MKRYYVKINGRWEICERRHCEYWSILQPVINVHNDKVEEVGSEISENPPVREIVKENEELKERVKHLQATNVGTMQRLEKECAEVDRWKAMLDDMKKNTEELNECADSLTVEY